MNIEKEMRDNAKRRGRHEEVEEAGRHSM